MVGRRQALAGVLGVTPVRINMVGMAGQGPRRGPNLETVGARLVDMMNAYGTALRALALRVGADEGIALQ